MGKLHFVGGEKGGVGKSFTARLLAQYFIDSHTPFIGFDSDSSHATFTRFYGEYTSPVLIDSMESLDQIIESAEENSEQNIVVDLAAQTAKKLDNWIRESDFFAIMKELDFTVYFWHVMDDGADSMIVLQKLLETYSADKIELVIVQNHGRGKSFVNFEKSATHQAAKNHNARFIRLPNLHEALTQKIDFNNLSFWAAANNKNLMKTVERHRVATWMNFSYKQIQHAFALEQVATSSQALNEYQTENMSA